ncbi:cytochrome c peroxidase [Hyalangium gracile]|uniref:cytochrome c peroxidase n=1 Tax=Hyalangium gracile TaxID=394092 RepID=UPI001CCB0432|nr:cytochrome c peroxidase [Hyalangium gracile]
MNPFSLKRFTLTSLMMLAAAGCGGPTTPDEQPQVEETEVEETWDAEQEATLASTVHGAYLFTKETFKGNGRTCATCHTLSTGGLTPAQAQAAWQRNRNDPLFRAIDSDAGDGKSYSRLLNDATVTVDVPMAPNIRLAANPTARTVKLRRGIPSTLDSPRFDPVVMWDGREPTLQSQAMHAIAGHAQGGRVPTQQELNALVDFEKVLFSSAKMAAYALTGTPPPLPAGKTASEKRGAAFFAPNAVCGHCHFGPLLNQMTEFNPQGLPAGTRFSSAGVSEGNLGANPPQEFIVTLPNGAEVPVLSPDPGLMLLTGDPAHYGVFKMVSLRNLKNTAPYFHDNSAKNLDQVMVQYKLLFDFLGVPLSQQDIADITAYMKLL